MDLLKYEFMKSNPGSHNYNVGELVRKVRYYRNEVPAEEFKAALPELLELERKLNEFHDIMDEPRHDYVSEILSQLAIESETESLLFDEITRTLAPINKALYKKEFKLNELSFSFKNDEAVNWVEFYGYKDNKEIDGTLLVAKEVFRSVCYNNGIIFVDISLNSL